MENPKYDEEDINLLHIFVDADACPVKQEVYRVASRYSLNVTLVANSWMRIPDDNRRENGEYWYCGSRFPGCSVYRTHIPG